ncbi:hypothetical protein AQUCO_00900885v1 [Aquilegia coerulea]|uniref:1-(5-phosphoribosyl)-5-[(5-phosphoribosylamino)methylideneamino] imidazole-4-carboxamide isomerase HISN3, chloroplastic n=1 Tax=Aquilegia coerulea TaxID=218851 RepID=A0A2G5EGB7_AQUCA|nr:hypothetical protein AQUCO_00900885v1 [Aquilegia coerulea]
MEINSLLRHSFMDSQSIIARSSSNLSSLCRISHSANYILQKKGFITVLPIRCSKSRYSIHCAAGFRPCIDIHKGKVKQIVGSTLQDLKDGGSDLVTNFESDKSASEYADLYKRDGLTGGHVIMLGADSPSISAATEALHAYPGGLQVGGGINSDNALSYIEEGASHVIVTSYVFKNGHMDLQRLKDLVRIIGKKRLVLDLSCRKKDGKYAIVTDRWQKFSNVYVNVETLDFLAVHADEFLVHGVDVEGKRLGIDEELVALLGKHSPVCALSGDWFSLPHYSVELLVVLFIFYLVFFSIFSVSRQRMRQHSISHVFLTWI